MIGLANKSRNKVRIISGRLRGRMVGFPDESGLRPTGDRLRETLFSWLQAHLSGSGCLDMFAGSGVLGFEAVSRGAGQVVLFEKSASVYAQLCRSVDQLGLDNVTVHRIDATSSSDIVRASSGIDKFNVVFIDPPFAQMLHETAIDALMQADVLAQDAMICLESGKRQGPVKVPEQWTLQREKIAGEVRLCLYSYQPPPVQSVVA